MIKLIYDGLSIENDRVVYIKDADSPNDVMNVIEPDIYKSEFGGNVYYFGYAFKDSASRKDRTTIIKWLKGIGEETVSEPTLKNLIDKAILYFNKNINLSEVSCIVSPRSERSALTSVIVKELNNFAQRNTIKTSVEFIKSLPKDVSFDWEMFDDEYEGEIGDNQYNQIKNYIETDLLPKIHNLDYFSIADSVKVKYRRYIKDYLSIDSRSADIIKSIQDGKILIVDDINTSGSTLTEILRIVRKINNKCEVFIFTLIGKD